jgi:hypothetical protein
MVDPATGALVVRPECRLEIERALSCAARSIALRHQLSLPLIYLRYLSLSLSEARLRLLGKLGGVLLQFTGNRHVQSSKPRKY